MFASPLDIRQCVGEWLVISAVLKGLDSNWSWFWMSHCSPPLIPVNLTHSPPSTPQAFLSLFTSRPSLPPSLCFHQPSVDILRKPLYWGCVRTPWPTSVSHPLLLKYSSCSLLPSRAAPHIPQQLRQATSPSQRYFEEGIISIHLVSFSLLYKAINTLWYFWKRPTSCFLSAYVLFCAQ